MHFVDHVDLEAADHRLVDSLVEQLRYLVDTAVRGRVEFVVVDETACVDVAAGIADAARVRGDAAAALRAGAVERFGEDARDRRLADTARAGEKIRVMQALLGQRIRERLHDVFLAHQRIEVGRPVLAGEDDV